MAKVSLRSYNREIEKLIENSQLDEAIAHCRHILKTFPKYLETYRLLGKAYLEAKRYTEAVDIFQRVLIAVPDDFVSHVGMSIISDDQNKLDNALWHMERAFEVQPSNSAIQAELQRLFGRRDGQEPPKIRLTRGALAHMYVQGELFTQAISEINAVLANDPQRTDMKVLLAKAYFRNGQKNESTDICTQLLRQSIYCFDANRIMVDLLPGTQRAESTQVFRTRVYELDPYAAFAQDSVFLADSVPDASVNLERFQYTGEVTDSASGWQDLGITLASDAASMSSNDQQPDWLKAASNPGPSASLEPAPAAASASPAEEEIPDFLRQAGWGQSSGQFDEAAPAFDEPEPGGGAVQADLPDWIKAMAPKTDSTPAVETPEVQPASQSQDLPDWLNSLGNEQSEVPAASSSLDNSPSWLKELGEPVQPTAPAAGSQTSNDVPDWLKDLGTQEETPSPLQSFDFDEPVVQQPVKNVAPAIPAAQDVKTIPPVEEPEKPTVSDFGNLGTSLQEQDDAMAWLESLASKHGAKPEELLTDPTARTEVAPDWVDKAKTVSETPAAQPVSTSADETGMWLRNLEEQEAKSNNVTETPTPSQPAETPDWLLGPAISNAPAANEDVPSWLSGLSNEEPASAPEPEIPASAPQTDAWLSELEPVADKPAANEDLPAWLNDLSKDETPAAPAPEPEISAPADDSAPAWLNELGPAATMTAPTASQDDVPDWLRGMSTPEPEPTEPVAAPQQDFSFDSSEPASLPDWLSGLDKEDAPQAASRSDMPSWLQNDAEPEMIEPANPADWHPAMTQEPAPAAPEPVAPSHPVVSEMEPAFEEEPKPVKKVAPKPEKKSAAPRLKQTSALLPRSADSLANAQAELARGNISTSLEIYQKLIRKGKFLEEIIRDLREALYRYPVEVSIWQSLGDAYMRGNRLQEALDSYTKAEELLR